MSSRAEGDSSMDEDRAGLHGMALWGLWLILFAAVGVLIAIGAPRPVSGLLLIPNSLVFIALGTYQIQHRHHLPHDMFWIKVGPAYYASKGAVAIVLGIGGLIASI